MWNSKRLMDGEATRGFPAREPFAFSCRQRGTLTRTPLKDGRKFMLAPHCILRRLDLQESYLQSAGAAGVSLSAQLREVSASAAGHGAAQESDMGNVEVRGLAWRNRGVTDGTGSFL